MKNNLLVCVCLCCRIRVLHLDHDGNVIMKSDGTVDFLELGMIHVAV